MRNLFLYLIITLTAVMSLAVPQGRANEILPGIKGVDDRLVMPSGEYPWRAVGRVNTETGGHCTGVLVGPALVVTAAHCLYDRRKMWYVPVSQVHFVAGFRKGQFAAHTVAKQYFIPKGYDETAEATRRNAVYDWAIIQLEEAIGYQTGWFGTRPAALDEVFVQAGYSKDSKRVLSAHMGCPVLSQLMVNGSEGGEPIGHLIVHRCDAVPGDSGSPIFYYHDGKPYLAGIHVATTAQQRPVQGVAVPVSSFMVGITSLGGGTPSYPEDDQPMIGNTVEILLAHLNYPDLDTFFRAQGLETSGPLGYHTIGQLISAIRP